METANIISPAIYVGQYTKEYKINQSPSVQDEAISISYAKFIKGNANGTMPIASKIHQIILFFIFSLPL